MQTYLQAKEKTRELFQINIIGYLVQILFIFIGVKYFGIMGAIISVVLVSLLQFFINYQFYKKAATQDSSIISSS
jgi:O-antigen/teichoic acid export membrane protein